MITALKILQYSNQLHVNDTKYLPVVVLMTTDVTTKLAEALLHKVDLAARNTKQEGLAVASIARDVVV